MWISSVLRVNSVRVITFSHCHELCIRFTYVIHFGLLCGDLIIACMSSRHVCIQCCNCEYESSPCLCGDIVIALVPSWSYSHTGVVLVLFSQLSVFVVALSSLSKNCLAVMFAYSLFI